MQVTWMVKFITEIEANETGADLYPQDVLFCFVFLDKLSWEHVTFCSAQRARCFVSYSPVALAPIVFLTRNQIKSRM